MLKVWFTQNFVHTKFIEKSCVRFIEGLRALDRSSIDYVESLVYTKFCSYKIH